MTTPMHLIIIRRTTLLRCVVRTCYRLGRIMNSTSVLPRGKISRWIFHVNLVPKMITYLQISIHKFFYSYDKIPELSKLRSCPPGGLVGIPLGKLSKTLTETHQSDWAIWAKFDIVVFILNLILIIKFIIFFILTLRKKTVWKLIIRWQGIIGTMKLTYCRKGFSFFFLLKRCIQWKWYGTENQSNGGRE